MPSDTVRPENEQNGITFLVIIQVICFPLQPAGVIQVNDGELYVPVTDFCDGTTGVHVSDDAAPEQREEVPQRTI